MADNENENRLKQTQKSELYFDIRRTQWPIIYIGEYNIGFLGLEKLHPFDAGKWGRVINFLKEAGMIRDDTIIQPKEATTEDLMVVHPKSYIDTLKLTTIVEGIQEWSLTVAGITEIPPVAMLPNFVVQRKVLRPFRYQTGGTILAGKVAMERGWAINVGGGFHHCCATRGGGFCAYADITLCIRFLFERHPAVKKAMIIDLDAHQGNGHARDFMEDNRVYILDIYNRGIYPHDGYAKRGIRRKVEVGHMIGDGEYLALVRRHVEGALNEFHPDVVIFNAGTDILEGDPLGCMAVTGPGIIERDQIVFQKTRTRGIPIVMVTSGGYQQSTARIIANSMLNLRALGLITCDAAENAPLPEPDVPSAMPRSNSEGGIWAKFKRSANCMNMTRSQTSEQLARTGQSPSPDEAYRPSIASVSLSATGGGTDSPPLDRRNLNQGAASSEHNHEIWVENTTVGKGSGQEPASSSSNMAAVPEALFSDTNNAEADEEGVDMLTFMAQMKESQLQQEKGSPCSNPIT